MFLLATGTAEPGSVCSDSTAPQRNALSDCEVTHLRPPDNVRNEHLDKTRLDRLRSGCGEVCSPGGRSPSGTSRPSATPQRARACLCNGAAALSAVPGQRNVEYMS